MAAVNFGGPGGLTKTQGLDQIVQGGKVLLEATGMSARLKRWAVDSLESSYERRHHATIHGTNRQVIGSTAAAVSGSVIATGAALIATGAGAPIGIALCVLGGIGALVGIGAVLSGIRRNYKDRKQNSGVGFDRAQFVKDTFQNVTSGVLQALISKDTIEKWKTEKTQHQEKKESIANITNAKRISTKLDEH